MFRVQGSLGFWDLEFRVLGFRVSGFRVQGISTHRQCTHYLRARVASNLVVLSAVRAAMFCVAEVLARH